MLKLINSPLSQKQLFLSHKTVHVWLIKLTDFIGELSNLTLILSKNELNRSFEYQSKHSYNQFVISRAMVRLILAQYLGQEPKAIAISQTQWGKPELHSSDSMHFNLSHSGEFCLIAISKEREIGIDIECIDQNFDFEQAIGYINTEEELVTWKLLSTSEKVDMFYRKWVSVEAFLKAHGTGWLADQKLIKQAKAIAPHLPVHGYDVKFFTKQPVLLDVVEGYVSSLCLLNPPFSIEFKNGNDLFSRDDHMFFPN